MKNHVFKLQTDAFIAEITNARLKTLLPSQFRAPNVNFIFDPGHVRPGVNHASPLAPGSSGRSAASSRPARAPWCYRRASPLGLSASKGLWVSLGRRRCAWKARPAPWRSPPSIGVLGCSSPWRRNGRRSHTNHGILNENRETRDRTCIAHVFCRRFIRSLPTSSCSSRRNQDSSRLAL